MNLKVEYGIIAILSIAIIYYIFTHYSLLRDLSNVPHDNNPQLKKIKDKHTSKCGPDGGFDLCCSINSDWCTLGCYNC